MAYSNGAPQPSHRGSAMNRTRDQASADIPGDCGRAAWSRACGGKIRSMARPASALTLASGFQNPRLSSWCALMNAPPRLFDRPLHRARLDRAAPRFAGANFLKTRAAGDAVERLETILRSFPLAVDLGARDGAFSAALAQSDARERVGLVIEADFSDRMLSGRPGPRVAPRLG